MTTSAEVLSGLGADTGRKLERGLHLQAGVFARALENTGAASSMRPAKSGAVCVNESRVLWSQGAQGSG